SGRGVLAADASGAEWACVGVDLLEGAGEGPGVGVGKVLGEVAVDAVAVVAAGALHRLGALLGEHDEDRAAVVGGADAADEPGVLHAVDDTGEAALAVQDLVGELGHGDAVW